MPNNSHPRQARFVAEVEQDAPLEAIDAVRHTSAKPRTLWTDAWATLSRRPLFWISAVLILLVVFIAIFPGLFTHEQPNDNCLLANSDGAAAPGHPLGFTRQGCDVYARVLYGAQASVMVGFLATLIVTVLGIIVGAIAGYYGGWIDTVLSRLGDIFFAIPVVLGSIVIMSTLKDRTPLVVAVVIAIFAWPQIARIMRGSVMTAKQSDYVTASVALGLSRFRILLRHVLPNAIAPVIAVATVSLGSFIVAESTLSFLGIGLPPSTMSWGNDISQARASLSTNPLALIYPAGALSITVLSFLMLGDVVTDALNPKERARR